MYERCTTSMHTDAGMAMEGEELLGGANVFVSVLYDRAGRIL